MTKELHTATLLSMVQVTASDAPIVVFGITVRYGCIVLIERLGKWDLNGKLP